MIGKNGEKAGVARNPDCASPVGLNTHFKRKHFHFKTKFQRVKRVRQDSEK